MFSLCILKFLYKFMFIYFFLEKRNYWLKLIICSVYIIFIVSKMEIESFLKIENRMKEFVIVLGMNFD